METPKQNIMHLMPEVRRIVMTYAARENIAFITALECLVMEGVKSLCNSGSEKCPLVDKAVQKLGVK